MTYGEAMEYISGIARFGSHLGLQNVRTLMQYLGNPQDRLKIVHVGGTNGKGSTVSFLSHILMRSGYKTGIYTSPYIERFTERIRIGDEEIGEDDLGRLTESVRDATEEMLRDGYGQPTEFEIVCAIAFLYFTEQECDICVVEVGLGGRLDATNVIPCPLLAVITTISYDHMEYLGNTLGQIAFEKAGIIKRGGDVLLYPQEKEAGEVFLQVSREREACLHHAAMPERILSADLSGTVFLLNGREYRIRMLGLNQTKNASMAVHAAVLLQKKGYSISEDDIREGLWDTTWPGRFELRRKDPCVILDGAHNLEGMQVLAENLRLYFGDKKIRLIIGILKDKEYGKMLDVILPKADCAYAVCPPSDRALPAGELAGEIRKRSAIPTVIEPDPAKAYDEAVGKSSREDVVVACGSLYYLGILRKLS